MSKLLSIAVVASVVSFGSTKAADAGWRHSYACCPSECVSAAAPACPQAPTAAAPAPPADTHAQMNMGQQPSPPAAQSAQGGSETYRSFSYEPSAPQSPTRSYYNTQSYYNSVPSYRERAGAQNYRDPFNYVPKTLR